MRIVCTSDTHSLHYRIPEVPDGDVLIHAGDIMSGGWDWQEVDSFNNWLGTLPHKHKIVIAGNHDWLFYRNRAGIEPLLTNATYLENSGVEIDGFRFWGSPVQPEFMNWAFNVPRGEAIKRYWDQIPLDTDVLITHGPPMGIRDWTRLGDDHLGCEELLAAINRVRPQLHVFGHIHGGAGQVADIHTYFCNASFLNEAYRPWFRPLAVYDLEVPRANR